MDAGNNGNNGNNTSDSNGATGGPQRGPQLGHKTALNAAYTHSTQNLKNSPKNTVQALQAPTQTETGIDKVLSTLEQEAGGHLQDIVTMNSKNIALLFMMFSAFSVDADAIKRSEEIGDDCTLSQWGLNDHIQTVVRPFLCAQLEQQGIQVPKWLSVNDGFSTPLS